MHVRQLKEEDWQAYRTLRLEAVRLHAANYGLSYMQEAAKTEDEWRALMSHDTHQCFGLFDGQDMVGIGAVFTDGADGSGKTAFLAAGYIRLAYRGKGYSSLLYEHRIQWAIDSGRFHRIMVGHRHGNEASRRANQRFGFEYIGAEEKTFGDGNKAMHHQYEVRLR